VVPVDAELAAADAAAVGGCGLCGQHGSRIVASQPQCAVPRLPLCGAFSGAVWVVCEPGGLFELDCAGQVAASLLSESDGGGDRGVPLGDYWQGCND